MTRWGNGRIDMPGLPMHLPTGMTQSQISAFLLHIRLEEINKKLKLATNDKIKKKQLEDERAQLIEEALQQSFDVQKDIDYNTWLDRNLFRGGKGGARAGGKFTEKIYIPQKEYPDINFIGLLIGPRGNTLKKMETETGAKIAIRGKGAAKDGKMDPASLAAADEDLHAYICADTPDRLQKAIKLIEKIIETAASTPEEANELKKLQLRELAFLNGTIKEEDAMICTNCGQFGHRKYECLERRNVTQSVICKICGGAGHTATDCLYKNDPEMLQKSRLRMEHLDWEYQNMMNELNNPTMITINNKKEGEDDGNNEKDIQHQHQHQNGQFETETETGMSRNHIQHQQQEEQQIWTPEAYAAYYYQQQQQQQMLMMNNQTSWTGIKNQNDNNNVNTMNQNNKEEKDNNEPLLDTSSLPWHQPQPSTTENEQDN